MFGNSMNEQTKFAAVLYTDIVSYAALMSKDKDRALQLLHKNRDFLKPLIEKHNGKWLKEIEDSTISCFPTSEEAVNCALEIQRLLKDDHELSLRIGIHFGNVVCAEGAVFGESLNVATRIEPLVKPGGIGLSERVYYDVRNIPGIEADFLGEKRLKNVDHPVKVYSLKTEKVPTTASASMPTEEIEDVRRRVRRLWFAVIGVVIIVIGYTVYTRIAPEQIPVTEEEEIIKGKKSIAVLPFVNRSADPEQEYFCDGIADAILNALTHVGDLRVIARSSSFAFRGDAVDISEVGKKLNVEWVLEGSVQKAGNELLITAQLIKVADLSHLFSDTYERELKDVFAIQEEIARTVVDELKVKLLEKEKVAIDKRYTDNTEAYNLYLQGRYYWNKRTEEGLKKGIELFQQAIEQDPTFALAYAGLADSYNLLPMYGSFPTQEDLPKAKAASLKALEIDNTLAEAYTSLAFFRFSYEWDWITAEQEFKRAIVLNPGYATAHHWYAEYLGAIGQLNESIAEMKRAQELDPLSPIIKIDLGEKFYYMRKYDQAIEQYRKTLDMYPNFDPAYRGLIWVYVQKGKYEEAIDAFQKAREITGATGPSSLLGRIYAISGERDKAEQILHALIERKKERFVPSTSIASIYAGLGETDKAFEWLEKACEERTFSVIMLKVSPYWDGLRSDPRFTALLKKIGLPTD